MKVLKDMPYSVTSMLLIILNSLFILLVLGSMICPKTHRFTVFKVNSVDSTYHFLSYHKNPIYIYDNDSTTVFANTYGCGEYKDVVINKNIDYHSYEFSFKNNQILIDHNGFIWFENCQ